MHTEQVLESQEMANHPPVDHAVVQIHVNENVVRMIGHRHNGLEIKEAAIAQHVKIGIDFLLYLLRHHQPNQPIGDTDEVTITEESRFHAIADDDNS